jgi:hypothetical protein
VALVQGKNVEAGKEAAVFKARSEGWRRDAEELRGRISAAEVAAKEAREEREAALQQVQAVRLEAARAAAAAEQQVCGR